MQHSFRDNRKAACHLEQLLYLNTDSRGLYRGRRLLFSKKRLLICCQRKWAFVMSKEVQGHMHGRSLSIVEKFIGVKRNICRRGWKEWAGSSSSCPKVLANSSSWFQEQSCCLSNSPTSLLILPVVVLGPPPTNPFPGSSVVPGPYPIWSFPHFCRLDSSPLWSPFLPPSVHASKFCLSSGFSCTCAQQRKSPGCISLPREPWRMRRLSRGGGRGWELVFPVCLRLMYLWWRMWLLLGCLWSNPFLVNLA